MASPIKPFLSSLHDIAQWCLHIALIPVMACLKAVIFGLQHMFDALSKI